MPRFISFLSPDPVSPGGGTEIEQYHVDGSLFFRSGTRIIHEGYSYSTETNAGAVFEKRTVSRGTGSDIISSSTYTDVLGRVAREVSPNPSATDPNREIVRKTGFSAEGDVTAVLVNGTTTETRTRQSLTQMNISTRRDADTQVVSSETQTIAAIGGQLYEVTTTPHGGYKRQLTGLLGAPTGYGLLASHSVQFGRQGHTLSESFTYVNRATKTTREETWSYGESSPTVRISRNGILQSELPSGYSAPILYATDGIGRVKGVKDPRTGQTRVITYSSVFPSQIASVTLAAPNAQGVVETHTETRTYFPTAHQNAGKLQSVTRLGQTTNYAYNEKGQRTHVWGAQYPLKLEYNAAGQLAKLHTYRAAPGALPWPSGDITEWRYYAGSGKLYQKLDAKQRIAPEKPVTYTYDEFGNIASRTWARGVTTTYSVDLLGQVKSVGYGDGTPSIERVGDDGEGRYIATIAGDATWMQTVMPGWDTDGQQAEIETEAMGANSSSPLLNASYGITRTYNVAGQIRRTQLYGAGTDLSDKRESGLDQANPYARYQTIYEGGPNSAFTLNSAVYRELNGEGVTLKAHDASSTNGQVAFHVQQSQGRDKFDRLVSIGSSAYTSGVANPPLAEGHTFLYDAQGRRTRDNRHDGTHWNYGYNVKNEVIDGTRYDASNSALYGWAFSYTFDEIGNRTLSVASSKQTIYTPNALNQYTAKTNPDKVMVVGETSTPETVVFAAKIPPDPIALNNSSVATKVGTPSKYFYKEIDANNSAGPQDISIGTIGKEPAHGGQPERQTLQESGRVLVPPINEVLAYDADGNTTDDGLWHYTWDAENRLTSATTHVGDAGYANVPVSARKRIIYAYDYRSRMIRREVYGWNGTGFNNSPETAEDYTHFIYDGWNLIAEVSRIGKLIRRYYWGLDLSGTTDGAGGVGGLVAVQHFPNANNAETWDPAVFTVSFPIYDGNGNILAYYDATTGARVADFAYGPFGETIRATGPRAADLPLRWSTKYTDAFTGHKYYGYRWLGDGRWLNRDPIGEAGGRNLYACVANRVVMRIDKLGMASVSSGAYEVDPDLTSRGGGTEEYNKTWRPLSYTAWAQATLDYPDSGCIGELKLAVRVSSLGNALTTATIGGGTNLEAIPLPDKTDGDAPNGHVSYEWKMKLDGCKDGQCAVEYKNMRFEIRLKGGGTGARSMTRIMQSHIEVKWNYIANGPPPTQDTCCEAEPKANVNLKFWTFIEAGFNRNASYVNGGTPAQATYDPNEWPD